MNNRPVTAWLLAMRARMLRRGTPTLGGTARRRSAAWTPRLPTQLLPVGDHPDSVVVGARRPARLLRPVVVVLDGKAPGYSVRYVDTFVPDASGGVVDLRGKAALEVVLLGARAHDGDPNPTYTPRRRRNMVDVSGFQTFRQANWGGTFEGTTTIGLGVRARLPFRVFTLDGPGEGSRLVIDVAHRW